ncbi:MAG: hypothetical protein Q8Q08_07525 [Candidatus Omnitrophota bacterium]|nr:hypothetical protein [Candidatus Omnitrophota bacterium]MDZ4243197.1 hypothetical protein [Candidatus Omnitrophota bacterium]
MDIDQELLKNLQANNKELKRIAEALVVLKVSIIAFVIAFLVVTVKNFL